MVCHVKDAVMSVKTDVPRTTEGLRKEELLTVRNDTSTHELSHWGFKYNDLSGRFPECRSEPCVDGRLQIIRIHYVSRHASIAQSSQRVTLPVYIPTLARMRLIERLGESR